MAETRIDVDKATIEAINSLRTSLGAKTGGEVISRALALAHIAAQNADSENMLTILSRDGDPTRVSLAG